MSRTLVVTNDFPTRRGGIEAFVYALCDRMPPDEVVVYTASMPGAVVFDGRLRFPVVRDRSSTLLPTPAVAARVERVFRDHGCDRVVFGAAAPLGLLAPRLREAGARRIVGLTHGHETWWARTPGARAALRRIGDSCDALTYVSGWCRDVVATALSPDAAGRMERLAPGVDAGRFRPGCGGAELRSRLGIGPDVPVVVCTARMVARKGQDTLLRAWPRVLDREPGARLLVVGDGPRYGALTRLAGALGVEDSVVFTGGVPWERMSAYVDAGNVFAMPCRTRLGGLEPEALGIVALEAQACGLPVVIGDSGGASEAVRHGATGYVVDPYNPVAVATRLVGLLRDRDLADGMGAAGREWVASEWTWPTSVATLRRLLGDRGRVR
ncbi:MAG: glycosyltransferase [Propionibacteriales bacterium]|nr:glycosyltransferase [Propionibacteriales bacterium]